MAGNGFPIDNAPAYTGQALRDALSVLMGVAPAGRPLGAVSGVREGTPTNTVTMSGGGSTTWNVAAHSGILDTESAAAAGGYLYSVDGTDTGTITAADATNPRIDIIYVKVNDTIQDGSGLTSVTVNYLAGTPAATPSAPATPARGLAIAQINVPVSGGGAPTVSWVAPVAMNRGAWTAYTPTLTNITLGNGTMTARFTQVGAKTYIGSVIIAAGSTTTYSAGNFRITTPVTATSINPPLVAVGAGYVDNGTPASRYPVAAYLADTTHFQLDVGNGTSAPNNVTNLIPFTFGTGANISFTFLFEAA
jgi:hypothetical protein